MNAATLKDLFDEHYYADKYTGQKEAYGYDREALWNHYVQHGPAEGRPMNELFDVKKYREQYADLNTAFGDDTLALWKHYQATGAQKDREARSEEVEEAERKAAEKAVFDYLLITSKNKKAQNALFSRFPDFSIVARGGFEPSTLRV